MHLRDTKIGTCALYLKRRASLLIRWGNRIPFFSEIAVFLIDIICNNAAFVTQK